MATVRSCRSQYIGISGSEQLQLITFLADNCGGVIRVRAAVGNARDWHLDEVQRLLDGVTKDGLEEGLGLQV